MKITMNIFLIFLLFIGLALTVCSFILASYVADCSIHAQSAHRGLLTMGVALFSISGTMLSCQCAVNFDKDGSLLSSVFPVFIFAIGIITFGLIITINNECKSVIIINNEGKGVKTTKTTPTLIPIMLSLSVLVTLAAGGYIGQKIYNRVKNTNSTKISPASPDGSPISSSRSDASGYSTSSMYGG
jgi:hypothetical protein